MPGYMQKRWPKRARLSAGTGSVDVCAFLEKVEREEKGERFDCWLPSCPTEIADGLAWAWWASPAVRSLGDLA